MSIPLAAIAVLDPAFALALRAALALLFGAAALHKLRDPAAFRTSLEAYGVLPAATAGAGAALVVAAEVAAAAHLVGAAPAQGGPAAAAGPLLAAALLAVYGAAIAWNLARGRRELDCGCLGPAGRQPLSGWLVARNG
ncbi:MAG TPA: MauE/DoxX family redox-associated membrane protein, partial [Myxococcota bacterium]|nr:MauE/DoxX family redox-associated membrane protein [Myxococcota bacterium]